MKRLKILGKALRELGLEKEIISLGSYSRRRIDILSYSRKILNLFFGWLSDRMIEKGRAWDRLSEEEKEALEDEYYTGDPEKYTSFFGRIGVSIEREGEEIANVKGYVDGVETLIRQVDLNSIVDIFGEEGARIFFGSPSHFSFRFFPDGASYTGDFREGGVVMGGGIIAYSLIIRPSDFDRGSIEKEIPRVYKNLLEMIVHEHTHVQQSLLSGELLAINPEFLDRMDEELGDSSHIELRHKNMVNKRRVMAPSRSAEEQKRIDEEILREMEEMEDFPPPPEPTREEEIEGVIRAVDQYIPMSCCSEENGLEKELVRKIFGDGGSYSVGSMVLSDNYISCRKKMDKEEERREKEEAIGFHSNVDTKISDLVEYYNKPEEIDAYIRGWRANMSVLRGKSGIRNLALFFKNYFLKKGIHPDELKKLWEKYKATYRAMNYPEKYLGTDEEALIIKKK